MKFIRVHGHVVPIKDKSGGYGASAALGAGEAIATKVAIRGTKFVHVGNRLTGIHVSHLGAVAGAAALGLNWYGWGRMINKAHEARKAGKSGIVAFGKHLAANVAGAQVAHLGTKGLNKGSESLLDYRRFSRAKEATRPISGLLKRGKL